MDKVSVLVTGKPSEELVESLFLNAESVLEVITPSPSSEESSSLPVKSVETGKLKGGALLNALVKEASSDYLLIVKPTVSFEEEFIQELLEEFEENPADAVFPNIILRSRSGEEVKNYQQVYGREVSLVASLSLEDWIPGEVILFKKEALERGALFDEDLWDYEIYDFLYRNLRWIKLRLAELSYATYSLADSFIDTAWRSYALRKRVLKEYDWKRELFPFLSWDERPEVAEATALTLIGKRLASYFDYLNASDYLRRALLRFHNQESLRELIEVLVNMGLFKEAKELLSPVQGMEDGKIEAKKERIEKLESLIEELEKAVGEGKLEEVLAVASEVIQVYQGAPIHNLLGFIYWVGERREEAYRFFYKAVTMNPVDRDYLYNLASAAKELGREEEVEKLVRILVGEGDG